MQFLIDYFAPDDSTGSNVNLSLSLNHAEIINGRFAYHNRTEEALKSGFDPNHIDAKKLNLYISELDIDSNDISATYLKLSLKEKDFSLNKFTSAFEVSEKNIALRDLHLQTDNSEILGHIDLETESWSDYNDFIKSVNIQTRFLPSDLSMKDLSYFIPDLTGLNDIPQFSGIFTGTVNNLSGKKVYGLLADFAC